MEIDMLDAVGREFRVESTIRRPFFRRGASPGTRPLSRAVIDLSGPNHTTIIMVCILSGV